MKNNTIKKKKSSLTKIKNYKNNTIKKKKRKSNLNKTKSFKKYKGGADVDDIKYILDKFKTPIYINYLDNFITYFIFTIYEKKRNFTLYRDYNKLKSGAVTTAQTQLEAAQAQLEAAADVAREAAEAAAKAAAKARTGEAAEKANKKVEEANKKVEEANNKLTEKLEAAAAAAEAAAEEKEEEEEEEEKRTVSISGVVGTLFHLRNTSTGQDEHT